MDTSSEPKVIADDRTDGAPRLAGGLGLSLRPVVANFAQRMEAQLRKNEDKDGWDELSIDHLLICAQDEIDEAVNAWRNRHVVDRAALLDECADAMNYLMMVYDLLTR